MTRQETEQERRFRIAGEQPPFGRLLGVGVISAEPDRSDCGEARPVRVSPTLSQPH